METWDLANKDVFMEFHVPKVILRALWPDWMCLIGFRDFISHFFCSVLNISQCLKSFSECLISAAWGCSSVQVLPNTLQTFSPKETAGHTDSEGVRARVRSYACVCVGVRGGLKSLQAHFSL